MGCTQGTGLNGMADTDEAGRQARGHLVKFNIEKIEQGYLQAVKARARSRIAGCSNAVQPPLNLHAHRRARPRRSESRASSFCSSILSTLATSRPWSSPGTAALALACRSKKRFLRVPGNFAFGHYHLPGLPVVMPDMSMSSAGATARSRDETRRRPVLHLWLAGRRGLAGNADHAQTLLRLMRVAPAGSPRRTVWRPGSRGPPTAFCSW